MIFSLGVGDDRWNVRNLRWVVGKSRRKGLKPGSLVAGQQGDNSSDGLHEHWGWGEGRSWFRT